METGNVYRTAEATAWRWWFQSQHISETTAVSGHLVRPVLHVSDL